MKREYQLERLKREGYKITNLGKNIEAAKRDESFRGSVSSVFRAVFGYQ